MAYVVALLGTSGYRTHLVDLSRRGKILSTAITLRHPLPSANIMDHLHFCLGTVCKNCEAVCPESMFKFNELKKMRREEATA